MTEDTQAASADFNPSRLFLGSCLSLIATSVAFAVVGAVMGPLKTAFVLTNAQVGYIGGAALWGFTISIFVLGPLCDALGMKTLLRFAFISHLAGALIMIFANGFWMLFAGALVIALGNGTVEAACNPLVATVYPDRKTEKLNQFHVWFPGGIVIGAVTCFLLDKIGVGAWQLKIGLIIVPTVIYGFLFAGQKFPATERVQSGISFSGMLQGAFLRPLFWILILCMAVTASLELGPGRWVPAVLEAGGIPGILVLAYINGLMAVLRFFAGKVVERLAPTGILLLSAVLAGVGLYWFSFADSTGMAFASATVFAIGVCYFWPTMLGVTSERIPKSGALGLALMGGTGMLVVGLVTSPQMGRIADRYLHEALPENQTVALLMQVSESYPALAADMTEGQKAEVMGAVKDSDAVLVSFKADGQLPEGATANALRSAVRNAPGGSEEITGAIGGVLGPADNQGGRTSFRYVAPLSVILIVVFGGLFLMDRSRGGYKAEDIAAA